MKRTKYNIYGTLQGIFHPSKLNYLGERKYQGKQNPIYRSSYEKQCFHLLENNANIIWWKSEATVIPYISPIDNKPHRYYIDLTFCARDKNTGENKIYLIEVKPEEQTVKPVKKPRQRTKTFITQAKTYAVNIAKWNAAYKYAQQRGYKFYLWTEIQTKPYIPEVIGKIKSA